MLFAYTRDVIGTGMALILLVFGLFFRSGIMGITSLAKVIGWHSSPVAGGLSDTVASGCLYLVEFFACAFLNALAQRCHEASHLSLLQPKQDISEY